MGPVAWVVSEEDVERFLWDLERELRHLDGERRRELVQEAEQRLHEVATRIAEHEGAEHVEWYHYVQASAEIGPPERLARELTGEPLPNRERTHRWMIAGAFALVVLVAGITAYAVLSTGDLEEIGSWRGEEEAYSGPREVSFNVSEDADSVFLQVEVQPTAERGQARVTVLDGANQAVWESQSQAPTRIEDARFLEGEPGTWRVFLDFSDFTGSWSVKAQEERPTSWL